MSAEMGPRLGPPLNDHRAVCAYSLGPSTPQCTNEAEIHIAIDDDHYGDVCIATCLDHARIAFASGNVVDRHAFGGLCGLPGTLWHYELKRCVLDDSGEESQRVVAVGSSQPQPALSGA